MLISKQYNWPWQPYPQNQLLLLSVYFWHELYVIALMYYINEIVILKWRLVTKITSFFCKTHKIFFYSHLTGFTACSPGLCLLLWSFITFHDDAAFRRFLLLLELIFFLFWVYRQSVPLLRTFNRSLYCLVLLRMGSWKEIQFFFFFFFIM